MKRIFILFLILTLSACSTPTPVSFFDAITPSALTPAPAPDSAPAADSTPAPLLPESTASATESGELYFFLQPRQGGGGIELARVSAACISDSAACPPLEKISAPFALNFTINALSWSPDGKFAAFAYPDNANGTPQKLFIFDPHAKTWTSLAEFPYIDPPFWSPDGTVVAFRVQDGIGGEDVYVINPDGSGLRRISGSLPKEGRPYIMDGWYGNQIIMRPAVKAGSLYLLRVEDGTVSPMPAPSQFIAAPDASLFAYAEGDAAAQKQALKVVPAGSASSVTLAEFSGGSIYPVIWSLDSQRIAFSYNRVANGAPIAEVYIVNRDGSGLLSAYVGATVGRLIFSPSGNFLLVEETTSITGGHLYLVNLATLSRNILQAPGLSTDYDWYAPSWRP